VLNSLLQKSHYVYECEIQYHVFVIKISVMKKIYINLLINYRISVQ